MLLRCAQLSVVLVGTGKTRQTKGDFIQRRGRTISGNKQLLDEVEHDIMNYQNRGLCYLPKPKAEADNTDTRF